MVASRRRELISQGSNDGYNTYNHVDLENGNGHHTSSTPRMRFKDAVEATMDNKRAHEMKRKLLDSVDHKGLEKFRKSEKEVRHTVDALEPSTMDADIDKYITS
jgi:hypothetical protein